MEIAEVEVDGWRRIVRFRDDAAGFEAIIAVHDATLGPGCGGCRMRRYETFDAALEDVKRLSRGMTYKNALGGIPFGGGKSVILADPRTEKTPELFRAFGRAVDHLGGLYVTAEDSGVDERDLMIAREATPHVGGLGLRGRGGNPSPFTARGVLRGIEAAARKRLGATSLDGVRVAILGVGAVGMELARLLHEAGARLTVADVDETAVRAAAERFDAAPVSIEDCLVGDVDVARPTALWGAIAPAMIGELKAAIVAGAANNQLATPEMDAALRDRGTLYAPDYVINAAGVISVGLEILGEWSAEEMSRRIDGIGDALTKIFERAEVEGRPTGEVADEMAQGVIAEARNTA
ncbi:MAG: Glu/Leu/Phe/Val dehydrogenase [Parvularculaceae bacterium]